VTLTEPSAGPSPAYPPPSRGIANQFQRFISKDSAGGVVLLLCAAVALFWANSPWSDSYFRVWETPLDITIGGVGLSQSLQVWISDGLMAVFFFLVGLEIKREMLVGELASRQKAMLPIAAAFGGMVVPAAIYALINGGGPGEPGWGIPVATDIAFALGVLSLLGPRIPVALKVFLAALAIADDIGAVLVIALFYNSGISWLPLIVGAVILALLILLNITQVRHPAFYGVLGLILWLCFHESGVHATVAGVLLAMTIPSRSRIDQQEFLDQAQRAVSQFRMSSSAGETVLSNGDQQEAIAALEDACEGAQAPLMRFENALHPIVTYGIMPLFALANAGVAFTGVATGERSLAVTTGVLLGLVVGKPIGITLASWLAVRSGMAALPSGASWGMLHAVSWLGGIGFTMSLFIAGLAFTDAALLDAAKVGILLASSIAGVVGGVILFTAVQRRTRATPSAAGPSSEPDTF
jgi:Na+:H+ antiporter, NhaA family